MTEKPITISLEIENRYEFGGMVVTHVTDEPITGPPTLDEEAEAYGQWAYDAIYPFTGTGRPSGKSWYDVTVTACTKPELVGRTFEFGDY